MTIRYREHAQLGEEAASGLVLDRGRAEGDTGNDDVLDEPREAQPRPCRGGEEHRARIGPERIEPAPKALALRVRDGVSHPRGELACEPVARAQHQHPPASPRGLDRQRDVVEVSGVGHRRAVDAADGGGRRAVGEPEVHRTVAPRLQIGPPRRVDATGRRRAGANPERAEQRVRIRPRGRRREGGAHEERDLRGVEHAAKPPYRGAVHDGERRRLAGHDGGNGARVGVRALDEGAKARGEQCGLLGGVLVGGGGGLERRPNAAHLRDDGVGAFAVREEPRCAPGGLARTELRKHPARRGAGRPTPLDDVGNESESDPLVGDASRGLGQGVGLVEEDGVDGGADPEHAAAVPAVGQHERVVGEHDVGGGRGALGRRERPGGRCAGARRHAERVGGESGGHEHPVVLGLGEGVECGERFERAPLGVSVPAPEPLDCALDAVWVDELAAPCARRHGDRRKPERFERPGNARGVVVEDLTGEVVGEGGERRAMRAHALALLKRSERHHRREQRHGLPGAGRGLGEGHERAGAGRGVEGAGDDTCERALLFAERGQRAGVAEHPLNERLHRADRGRHRSVPGPGAKRRELDVGGAEQQRMEPVRIASPAAGDAHERIIDARGAHRERPLAAQCPELDERAALRSQRIEAPREQPQALGVHVLGALGVAHGDAPARAEREPRRGEPGRSRDGEDERGRRG